MNIAEILKNCPGGMKLYSPIWGDIKFIKVNCLNNIEIRDNNEIKYVIYPNGKYTEHGEVILFPSKEQHDWNKFQIPFKFGDIVAMYNEQYQHTHIAIFDKYIGDKFMKVVCTNLANSNKIKIFDENGHWNKQNVRYASDEERLFFFSLLEEQNYIWTGKELIKNKFDLCSLKPYDRVLVKSDTGCWYPTLVSYVDSSGDVYLIDDTNRADYVIPFEGNEYLIGKWDDPDSYYITWQE